MTPDKTIEKKRAPSRQSKEPSKYKVIICNDNYTSVEFVISMLMSIFKHTEEQAIGLTLQIHNKGSGVAGVYGYEIAEQKGFDATDMARANGFPLVIKIESE